jgi:hypothetical protein
LPWTLIIWSKDRAAPCLISQCGEKISSESISHSPSNGHSSTDEEIESLSSLSWGFGAMTICSVFDDDWVGWNWELDSILTVSPSDKSMSSSKAEVLSFFEEEGVHAVTEIL